MEVFVRRGRPASPAAPSCTKGWATPRSGGLVAAFEGRPKDPRAMALRRFPASKMMPSRVTDASGRCRGSGHPRHGGHGPRRGAGRAEPVLASRDVPPDHKPALAHTLVGARDVDALHQRELQEQGAAERHVHLGAGRCSFPVSSSVTSSRRSSARNMNLVLGRKRFDASGAVHVRGALGFWSSGTHRRDEGLCCSRDRRLYLVGVT